MTTLGYAFMPTHPGEILKEEIQARGLSQKKVAEVLGVPYTMLNEILNCKRPLTTETALMFEAALDINADMLINIQARYNIQTARANTDIKNRFDAIRKVCASIL